MGFTSAFQKCISNKLFERIFCCLAKRSINFVMVSIINSGEYCEINYMESQSSIHHSVLMPVRGFRGKEMKEDDPNIIIVTSTLLRHLTRVNLYNV